MNCSTFEPAGDEYINSLRRCGLEFLLLATEISIDNALSISFMLLLLVEAALLWSKSCFSWFYRQPLPQHFENIKSYSMSVKFHNSMNAFWAAHFAHTLYLSLSDAHTPSISTCLSVCHINKHTHTHTYRAVIKSLTVAWWWLIFCPCETRSGYETF